MVRACTETLSEWESRCRTGAPTSVRLWQEMRYGQTSWRSKTSFAPMTMTTIDTSQPTGLSADAG
jgi:hypothetical protein